ncbi:MAG TPA: LacI family DNA-binding transcriptional regulator, partial [Solirubrobacterales bacterium]|nr:LacI family DNA-binding transcriptional regulator [Solirubrobacterales bacterium]
MERRTGIREIAREAGVSAATVSLALRGKGRMSEATRDRIKEIARAHDYHPNAAARSLTRGRTGLIAISMPGTGGAPEVLGSVQYFFRLLGAAAARALELEYGLLVADPRKGAGQTALDGAIVVDPAIDDPVVAACDTAGLPVVTIGRRLASDESGKAGTWVVDNDFLAATGSVLDHLAGQGARSIALMASEPIDSFQQDSIDAYRQWCAGHGVEARVVVSQSPDPKDATVAAGRLFDQGQMPDGVYATIDTLARALLDRAASERVAVPGELRIATCSNGELARTSQPQLTTLDEHPATLGEEAVELLVRAIEDPESAP